jgi:anti-sigma B factor antagonist
MSLQTRHGGLEIESVGRVTVVKFLHRRILTEALVETLGRQLLGLVEDSSRCHLVLNFGNVERLSSALLGKVVALERAVRGAGGRLAVCKVRPELNHLLKLTRLDKYMDLYASEWEALQDLL